MLTPEHLAEDAISRMVVNMDEVRQLSGYAWAGVRVELITAIRQAVAEEREACAKIAERFMCNSTEGAWPIVNDFASRCVQRIRERQ